MRELLPHDQPQTLLRLRRQLMAVYSYLFVWAAILLGMEWELFAADTPHVLLFVVVLLLNAVFFVLIRTGWSTRWRDPSLTIPQLIPGIILTTVLIHYSRELEGALLTLYFMVMIFGVFALDRLRMILVSVFVLICYLGMILLEWYHQPRELLTGATLGRFAILTLGLAWFVYMGGYISNLRARVQRQRQELALANGQLEHAMHRLEELAIRDPLTGLYNRRYFIERLEEELARTRRKQRGFFIGIMDLDHFKQINDTHGHNAGDAILRCFADCARSSLRESDLLARYGGEEFIILFTEGEKTDILGVAERLRRTFAEQSPDATPDHNPVTASLGVAAGRSDDDVDTVIERADQALYDAKEQGRNRVVYRASEPDT